MYLTELRRRLAAFYPPGRRLIYFWEEKRKGLPAEVVGHYPHFMLVRVEAEGGSWLTAVTWAEAGAVSGQAAA